MPGKRIVRPEPEIQKDLEALHEKKGIHKIPLQHLRKLRKAAEHSTSLLHKTYDNIINGKYGLTNDFTKAHRNLLFHGTVDAQTVEKELKAQQPREYQYHSHTSIGSKGIREAQTSSNKEVKGIYFWGSPPEHLRKERADVNEKDLKFLDASRDADYEGRRRILLMDKPPKEKFEIVQAVGVEGSPDEEVFVPIESFELKNREPEVMVTPHEKAVQWVVDIKPDKDRTNPVDAGIVVLDATKLPKGTGLAHDPEFYGGWCPVDKNSRALESLPKDCFKIIKVSDAVKQWHKGIMDKFIKGDDSVLDELNIQEKYTRKNWLRIFKRYREKEDTGYRKYEVKAGLLYCDEYKAKVRNLCRKDLTQQLEKIIQNKVSENIGMDYAKLIGTVFESQAQRIKKATA